MRDRAAAQFVKIAATSSGPLEEFFNSGRDLARGVLTLRR